MQPFAAFLKRHDMFDLETNPDAKLGRKEAAEALASLGYRIAEATLASMATRGGGPLFSKFGARVVYKWADVISWAEKRLTRPVTTTSELTANRLRQPQVPGSPVISKRPPKPSAHAPEKA